MPILLPVTDNCPSCLQWVITVLKTPQALFNSEHKAPSASGSLSQQNKERICSLRSSIWNQFFSFRVEPTCQGERKHVTKMPPLQVYLLISNWFKHSLINITPDKNIPYHVTLYGEIWVSPGNARRPITFCTSNSCWSSAKLLKYFLACLKSKWKFKQVQTLLKITEMVAELCGG